MYIFQKSSSDLDIYPFFPLRVNNVWEVTVSKMALWTAGLETREKGARCRQGRSTLFHCCAAQLDQEEVKGQRPSVLCYGSEKGRQQGDMKPVMEGPPFLEETWNACWWFVHFKAFGSYLVVKMWGCCFFLGLKMLAYRGKLYVFLSVSHTQSWPFLSFFLPSPCNSNSPFIFLLFFFSSTSLSMKSYSVWSVPSLISM